MFGSVFWLITSFQSQFADFSACVESYIMVLRSQSFMFFCTYNHFLIDYYEFKRNSCWQEYILLPQTSLHNTRCMYLTAYLTNLHMYKTTQIVMTQSKLEISISASKA